MHHYNMKKRYNSYSPTSTEMIRLCNEGLWMKVIERIQNDPNEAFIQDSTYGDMTTVLAIAIRNGFQCLFILDTLIKANPYQLITKHRHHGTILHELFQFSRYSSSSNNNSVKIGEIAIFFLQRILSFMIQQQLTTTTTTQQQQHSEHDNQHHHDNIRIVIKETSFDNYNEILTSTDGMGRTILHVLAEYVIDHGITTTNCCDSSLQLFTKEFLMVCPSTLQMIDHDGNTPLIVLLTAMPECSSFESNLLCNMICYFLHVDPSCATISRQVSSHSFQSMCLPNTQQSSKLRGIPNRIFEVPIDSNGRTIVTNTPLYFALLHKRSLTVIEALLMNCTNQNGKNNVVVDYVDDEIPIVTGYNETYLHICITTRAPLDIIKVILNHYSNSTLIPDMYGLTPIDWLWLCHVVDWNYNIEEDSDSPIPDYHYDFTTTRNNNTNTTYPIIIDSNNTRQQNHHVQSHRMLSRRRNLGGSLFQNWFQNAETSLLSETQGMTELCCNEYCDDDVNLKNSEHDNIITNVSTLLLRRHRHRQREKYLYQFFLQRLRLILPIAGEYYMRKDNKKFDNTTSYYKQWIHNSTVIHAACLIRCPMAVLHAAKLITIDDLIQHKSKIDEHIDCEDHQDQFNNVLHHRDMLYGRYPLHYATYHFKDYIAHYPIRPSLSHRGGIMTHYEPSPIYTIIQCCPIAASCYDYDSRLPIHILIDTINNSRREKNAMSHDDDDDDDEAVESQKIIQCLLDANPNSLEQRDGKTKLYLWQQAAIGDSANLNTIYILLRMQPTLLFSH